MTDTVGTFITVKIDPETNGGLEDAPALITGVYDDGSLRVRVFGATAADDTVRTHVGDDGEPFVYPDAQPAAPAVPAASAPVNPLEEAAVEPAGTLADRVAQLTPEQRAELEAALRGSSPVEPTWPPAPAEDAPPPAPLPQDAPPAPTSS